MQIVQEELQLSSVWKTKRKIKRLVLEKWTELFGYGLRLQSCQVTYKKIDLLLALYLLLLIFSLFTYLYIHSFCFCSLKWIKNFCNYDFNQVMKKVTLEIFPFLKPCFRIYSDIEDISRPFKSIFKSLN